MLLTISAKCRACPTSNSIEVFADDYRNYFHNNQLVQNVWPDLSPDQREVIMGHSNNFYLCASCWDKMGDEQ